MLRFVRQTERRLMAELHLDALAQFVFETRTRKKLSLPEIRRRGGPSIGWLGELESRSLTTIPKPDTLRRLANALGVTTREVFDAAGLEPITLEDRGMYPVNTPDQRRRYIELASERAYPPTPEEIRLIEEIPNSGAHQSRALRVDIFDTPPETRAKMIAMLVAVPSELDEVRSESETFRRAQEILRSLPEGEQQDVLRYLEMRARMIGKEAPPHDG